MAAPLLRISDLVVEFDTPEGPLRAVDGVSFEIERGETVGLVGESGCGKSVTALSVLGLVPRPGRVRSGRIELDGKDVLRLRPRALRRIRGQQIGMVFQDPMTALDPLPSIRAQIGAVLRAHGRARDRRERWQVVADLLAAVGVPRPRERARQHPHEWSGGMRQRAMIAMAIANDPLLLIADEPTTALDVTVQAQVIDVLQRIRESRGMATLFISHDLALVAEVADRIVVMYAGRIVESAPTAQLFSAPRHPYTRALIDGLPSVSEDVEVRALPGQPPSLLDPPSGCRFHPRCPLAVERCGIDDPRLLPVDAAQHRSACHCPDLVEAPRAAAVWTT